MQKAHMPLLLTEKIAHFQHTFKSLTKENCLLSFEFIKPGGPPGRIFLG